MKTIKTTIGVLVAMACAGCGCPYSPDGEQARELSEVRAQLEAGAAPSDPTNIANGAGPSAASPGVATNPVPATADAGALPPGVPAGCIPLGGSCQHTADCLCGLGAGCEWDNTECDQTSGTCKLLNKCVPDPSADGGFNCDGDAGPLLPMLDAGYPCCSACEMAYDQGGTLTDWLACNKTCAATDGFCPVTCYSQDVHL